MAVFAAVFARARMLSMLEKLGFAYCGIVHYDSGARLAYDLDLDLSSVL